MQYLFILVSLITASTQTFALTSGDPAAEIQTVTLPNGLKVVLAPSQNAKTVQVRVRVNAGFWSEEIAGVAHLLEHYMFKDAKMEKNVTYLEMIEENGGSGNASTRNEETTYYATVPPNKTRWLLGLFGQMFIAKQFIEEDVQFAKKPVYLEIGKPTPMHYFQAFLDKVIPKNLDLYPGFWQTEFNLKTPHRQGMPDQITTETLTAADLQKFYNKYYQAGNMTLFIAGQFEVKEVLERTAKIFAALPSGLANEIKPTTLKAVLRPYYHSNTTSGTARITVGSKLTDVTLEQRTAIQVYLEDLSHRLMKEMRNGRGETYTVSPLTDLRHRNGYTGISMEAPNEAYYHNLKEVRDLIEKEGRQGQITAEDFQKARDLFMRKFELKDRDTDTMMALAQGHLQDQEDYGENAKTPFQIYSAMTLEQYKTSLKNAFRKDMKYEANVEPPLFFRYEAFLFVFIGIIAWGRLTKALLTRNFIHNQIRWVRKFTYPAGHLLQFLAFLGGLLVFLLGYAIVYRLTMNISFIQSSFVLSDYLLTQVALIMLFASCQLVFALIGRKVMIVGGSLWIKSYGFWSTLIPIASIARVQTANPVATFLNPAKMWRIKYRFFSYDLAIWRPGLLLTLKDGRGYFLGVHHSRDAATDLQDILDSRTSLDQSTRSADAA